MEMTLRWYGSTALAYTQKAVDKLVPEEMFDDPHNGVTFCAGSYGTNLNNDLPDMIRYMMGINDKGEAFEISPDPLANTVQPVVADIKLGENQDVEETIAPLLHNDAIFGVDLYEVGLAPKVVTYFKELIAGPGAIRVTLKKYTA